MTHLGRSAIPWIRDGSSGGERECARLFSMFAEHAGDLPQAAAAAEVIVPIVVQLVGPGTAVDVGCGTGAWVRAMAAAGIDARGVDNGDPSDVLDRDRYIRADLANDDVPAGRYDLAVCLEVGEHLPMERADWLIASLVGLSDVVLFSAAVPGQRGPGHLNEQWPSWWGSKFASHGFEPFDVIRPTVWNDHRVARWYRQNTMLYARPHCLDLNPSDCVMDMVHPELYDIRRQPSVRQLPGVIVRSVRAAVAWRT